MTQNLMVQPGARRHKQDSKEMVRNEKGKTVEIKTVLDSTVFLDLKPCIPVKFPRRFGGTYCLHF
jgi:hypothetical protein